ncbi:glycosyltransferase family 2 protein [Microbacterium marinilacus]|uniref:Glycosyltransferase n=1 Tax=Microbacterium marinilacus TaxID=415209 RepID=A0ABP7BFP7_9MICO|nr:glycosyltransferase family 2 protein [Microbacterium marinilacus]
MDVTVIVPTRNERGNVAEVVRQLGEALDGRRAEILFVDDSEDGTVAEIQRVAQDAPLPVRFIHRVAGERSGGLSGAVVEGMKAASAEVCVVMDGDLQHPPSLVPSLVDRHARGDVDVVVASRYIGGGDSTGLGTTMRFGVSRVATLITKSMFPVRLHGTSDPMTGFFLVDRRRVDLEGLRPSGFKILLELLVRSDLRAAEVPMRFHERADGESKATMRQGVTFLVHLARLRFGKMSVFALIGASGAVANIAIVWLLTSLGMGYIWAAIIAAETTIIANFLLAERFVFADMRGRAAGLTRRFLASFAFNNAEAAIRIPVLAFLVETWAISSVLATAITLAVAFVGRFVFHSLVVYAPRRSREPGTETAGQKIIRIIDEEAMRPGEL